MIEILEGNTLHEIIDLMEKEENCYFKGLGDGQIIIRRDDR